MQGDMDYTDLTIFSQHVIVNFIGRMAVSGELLRTYFCPVM